MKKKLLTSAAIASFLTAAGVVIPQTDIFAADTLNTPHPSTVPGLSQVMHRIQVQYQVNNQAQNLSHQQ